MTLTEPGQETQDRPEHQNAAQAAQQNEIEQRRLSVAHLLVQHFTYRQIADELGVGHTTIGRDVAAIRGEWRERASASFDTYVAEEVAKLDAVERHLLGRVLKDDASEESVRAWKMIAERRAKLLGLDAPVRHELSGPGGGAIPIEERVSRLADEAEAFLHSQDDAPAAESEEQEQQPAAEVAP